MAIALFGGGLVMSGLSTAVLSTTPERIWERLQRWERAVVIAAHAGSVAVVVW